jgi:hypothetical protein
MLVQLILIAGDAEDRRVTVSTTVDVDTADPRWSGGLVDAITAQAQQGARQLKFHLVADREYTKDFVPLAAVVSAVAR